MTTTRRAPRPKPTPFPRSGLDDQGRLHIKKGHSLGHILDALGDDAAKLTPAQVHILRNIHRDAAPADIARLDEVAA